MHSKDDQLPKHQPSTFQELVLTAHGQNVGDSQNGDSQNRNGVSVLKNPLPRSKLPDHQLALFEYMARAIGEL